MKFEQTPAELSAASRESNSTDAGHAARSMSPDKAAATHTQFLLETLVTFCGSSPHLNRVLRTSPWVRAIGELADLLLTIAVVSWLWPVITLVGGA